MEPSSVSGTAIIGAGGFVGQSLIESLVLDGHVGVRAIVRSYRNMAGLCRYGSTVDVRRANAEDPASLIKALRGAHTVINLTTGLPAGVVRSTRAIFEACSPAGIQRFIHLSSAVVYGDVPTPITDDHPPVSGHWMPYARAKAASEIWLRERLKDDGPDIIVLRPGIVWGARSPHTLDIARALAGKTAYCVDGGHGIFNGIFIANLTSCIRACGEHPHRVSGFFNVGDHETVTWRQFFDALGPPLDCDPSRLPLVDGQRFPRSLRSIVETVQSLPLMNELYHRFKTHVPEGVKAAIRSKLEGSYQYERRAPAYLACPSVDREMWHLQRVRHKLPIDKFANTFRFSPPVSFQEGIRRTITWLRFLGFVSPLYPHSID